RVLKAPRVGLPLPRVEILGNTVDSEGVWRSAPGRDGWVFRLHLPAAGPSGGSVHEVGPIESLTVLNGGHPDIDAAEERWWCYGWPAAWGESGRRAFYIDERGILLVCENRDRLYEDSNAPAADAAFPPGAPGDGSVKPVPGKVATDGEVWEVWKRP
ncbi:MAG: hypothetical protein ACYTG4_14160, partial [Planctomycetota bacterium]